MPPPKPQRERIASVTTTKAEYIQRENERLRRIDFRIIYPERMKNKTVKQLTELFINGKLQLENNSKYSLLTL